MADRCTKGICDAPAHCREIGRCAEADYSTKDLLLAAQRAMVPQGHKAMPIKGLRKLGALIEAPWNDEAAPDVLRRIRRVWDEMHAKPAGGGGK